MGRPLVVDIVLQAVRVLCRILEGVLDAIDLVAQAKNLIAQRAVFLLHRNGIEVLAIDLVKRWRHVAPPPRRRRLLPRGERSEEHTSELQSLMRISYAVFCLKKKKQKDTNYKSQHISQIDHHTNKKTS